MRAQVSQPDHILVQDAQLLNRVQVAQGLKPGGWILLNSDDGSAFQQRFADFRFAAVDAKRIAVAHRLGTRTHPFINTAMIGAFARILEMPPMDALAAAIREDITVRPDDNVAAAMQAFESVCLFGRAA